MHEFHETCHSVTFHFMKKDSKQCCDTTTPESIHTKDDKFHGIHENMGGTKYLLSPTPKTMGVGHVPLSPTQTRPMVECHGNRKMMLLNTIRHCAVLTVM